MTKNATSIPSHPRLRIGPCALGQGVFARERIQQAEMILRFAGPTITGPKSREVDADSFNLLQIGAHEYLDLETPGVSLNHSCEPNAGVVDDTVLIALRDIAPGEEITFDYSTTMSEKLETMNCLCGTAACRQVIGDFHDLPPALKDRYLAARLVQAFIVREHREQRPIRIGRNGNGAPAPIHRLGQETFSGERRGCAAREAA